MNRKTYRVWFKDTLDPLAKNLPYADFLANSKEEADDMIHDYIKEAPCLEFDHLEIISQEYN